MTSLESEFSQRYIKTLTTWIVFHRMIYDMITKNDEINYYDAEAALVKMDMPSVLKVVKKLYETDRAGLDKLYEKGVNEIEYLKELANIKG